jgi:hypothetical protein
MISSSPVGRAFRSGFIIGALAFGLALVGIIVAASTNSPPIAAGVVVGTVIFVVSLVGSFKMRSALKKDLDESKRKGGYFA